MLIKKDPVALIIHQIESMYFEGVSVSERKAIEDAYPVAAERLAYCFSYIKNKYYHFQGDTVFNPYHVAQWTMFLYTMANQIKKGSASYNDLCDKIYGLSKCFSSADIYYEVGMPAIWFFDHPQGSVMGRAEYSDFFTFSQGCTVGNNKGLYPKFGEHVSLMSGSKVLGKCNVGHHVIIAANAFLLDQDIPPYSIVFGEGKNIVIHSISPQKFNELTSSMFDGDESALT